MTESVRIEGRAAALRIENLDTDQIIPSSSLRDRQVRVGNGVSSTGGTTRKAASVPTSS